MEQVALAAEEIASASVPLPPLSPELGQDKTFQMAVFNRAQVKTRGAAEVIQLTGDPANVVSIATAYPNFDTQYDLAVTGQWNSLLIAKLQQVLNATAPVDQRVQILTPAFGQLGIFVDQFTTANNRRYTLFVLPPYQSLYWDDFYNKRMLGQAAETVSLTPARSNLRQWQQNLSSFVPAQVLATPISQVLGLTVEQRIQEDLSYIISRLPEDSYKNLYVPIFGWNKTTDAFALDNAVFFISKLIYINMREQWRAVGGETFTEADASRWQEKFTTTEKSNIRLQGQTRSQFPAQPIYTIYVEPIEGSTPVLRIGTHAATKAEVSGQILTGTKAAARRKTVEEMRQCTLDKNCPIVGFIDYSKPVGKMPFEVSKSPAAASLSRLRATKSDLDRVKQSLEEKLAEGIWPMSISK